MSLFHFKTSAFEAFDGQSDERSGLMPLRGDANVEWSADQRFVHGLLRAMHSADAEARELRVNTILDRIEVAPRHNWRWVAAAAVLLTALSLPILLGDELPEARAAVMRGAALLADGGDRHFHVESSGLDNKRVDQAHQSFDLIARPGMHFVISGALRMGPIHFADMRFGCDGSQFWFHSNDGSEGGGVRRSGPLDEAPSLLRGIGNVLDLGLLDVHKVVQQLPHDFTLRSEGRTEDENGRTLVHVEATGGPVRPGFHLHRADLWCDEDTGMIVRLEVEADDGLGRLQRLSFRDMGNATVPGSIYDRPW